MIVRKSKNGFIAISIIYSFFLLFVLIILLIISTLIANRNNDNIYILDIKNRLSTPNSPPVEDNGSPSCTLKVSGNYVTWQEKNDDVGVVRYGLDTVQNSSNGKDTLTLAKGTFYGTVYDETGNKGTCSITIEEKVEDSSSPSGYCTVIDKIYYGGATITTTNCSNGSTTTETIPSGTCDGFTGPTSCFGNITSVATCSTYSGVSYHCSDNNYYNDEGSCINKKCGHSEKKCPVSSIPIEGTNYCYK